MNYYTVPPSASLADHVRFFWVLESDASYTHHGMADGCAEMVFHYNGVYDEWLPDGRIYVVTDPFGNVWQITSVR
jgi:hypothetical protein